MSIMARQIVTGIIVAFLFSVFLAGIVFFMFPLQDWSLLWKKEVMGLPFILFLPGFSLFIGLILGISSGLSWRRRLQGVEDALYQLEQGNAPSGQSTYSVQELSTISARIENVHKHVSEQAKMSQRMASEKVADREKIVREIVSQERNRLARELHDSVSQQLFAASMLMSAITESRPATENAETKQLKMVEGMIHQSQLEMRALLLHLRPVPLHDKSLQEGIQELLEELSQKVPMDISWKVEPIPLERGVEDHLFRILQESVSNTLRHAKANALEVLLIGRDGLIILRIVDDGLGFNVNEAKTGSYGLQNMHERAVEIGGTMKIVSVPNKGTRLEVKVPLPAGGLSDD
ncbi:sensor histidine kinase [Peribacillus cavernae]|uniref:Sensor histidine kinase n=1 Tax=Peribacillus cavernae TaxID=1674310 RepID=A0A3S0VS43_9BACI|nr:sensor histidine kinase [Peribacillus cavernae]MDQ0218611.1 NarL family two-component system sensor histidine kinase LiaS [Peribacillus cavernae]RUQ31595.1 sensor histidine kinase [Peribacillus cavernae]